MKAGELKVTSENPTAGEPVSFNVGLENTGTVDIDEYTIQLLDMAGDEPVVLETYEGIRYVAAKQTSSQTVKYTFENAGAYRIAARIVVADDVDETDNTTETLDVTVENAPLVYDVGAKSLEVTSDKTEVNEPVSFLVTMENVGTAEIDDYSIELIRVNSGEDTVLATFEGKEPVAVEATGSQTLEYTFTEKGDYKLAARIVLAGDADESNNTTPEISVSVNEGNGIDGVIAEGTLEYDSATATVRVNVGAGVLNVFDMAGRAVASFKLDGPAVVHLDVPAGVYYIAAANRSLKIMK